MAFEFRLPTVAQMQSSPAGLQMMNYVNEDDFGTVLLTGCAGSGKTTVAVHRLVHLISQNKPAKLFTYHRLLVFAIRQILVNLELATPESTVIRFIHGRIGLPVSNTIPVILCL